jgi:copper chaperone
MARLTLKINGMSCAHCKRALEAAIGQMEGVNSVAIDLERSLATIEAENEGLLEKIRETIIQAGYTPV